ncbi:MAG: hypothetical protein WA125_16135 [Desulfosporosinus sp.]
MAYLILLTIMMLSVMEQVVRRLFKPFNDSQAKIVRYLELPESVFAWNGA